MADHPDSEAGASSATPSAGPACAARSHWGLLVLGCGCTAAALIVDQRVFDWLSTGLVQHWIARAVAIAAAPGPYLIVLAILASFPNRRRLYAGFLVPVLVSTGALHLLKWAIGRARPLVGDGAFHFAPFAGTHPYDSFPSGHALGAGVLALLLGTYFPRARWVFYGLAVLIGLERMVTKWHYTSDVLAGYALAGLIVFGFRRLLGPAFYQKELREG